MSRARIAIALTTAAAACAASAGPAAAKDGDVVVRGKCSKTSTYKLKLSPENGRIETELEVDNNVNGRIWDVVMTDNGVKVFGGAARTVAPSGSFELRRLLVDRAGADRVVATARSRVTGETCRAQATFAA
jgi:hypothetical protein